MTIPQTKISRSRKTARPAVNGETLGVALIARLYEEMGKRGHGPKELAAALGISYPYLKKLEKGIEINHLGHDKLVSAAKYLKTPVAQAYLLAGVLGPEDFVLTPSLEERMERVRDAMAHDSMWSGLELSDAQWAKTLQEARLLICMLYEQAAKTVWLDWTMVPKVTQAAS